MKIISVNVMRHGSGKGIYVSVAGDGEAKYEFVVKGDFASVFIDRDLPHVGAKDCPVTVSQGNQCFGESVELQTQRLTV